MKRVLFVWILCLAASAGSFGVLLVEDRTLGLPLPYSVPLAFLCMLIGGPILQMIAAKVWPEPKMVIRPETPLATVPAEARSTPAASPAPSPAAARARAAAQGVVLFDVSRVTNPRQAA